MKLQKPKYDWYAVYTRINQEKKILTLLNEQKIECYLPLLKTLRQWSQRRKWVEEPLFRSYLFVKVSYKEFFKVLDTPGVVTYVSFGGKAQNIPDYQIENIKTFIKQEEKEITLTHNIISKGVRAEVRFGPLKGIKGEVIRICGQSRILIRIETIGCCLYSNISKEEVKLLQSGPKEKTGNKSQNHYCLKKQCRAKEYHLS